MKLFKTLILILITAVVFVGCKKDDFTGHSNKKATSPTITVDVSKVTAIVSDLEKSTHTITLTMDVEQIVDVKVYINLKDESTATAGDDFKVDASVIIPRGRKTASFDVAILADELKEDDETFTLTIGDDRTANATITPTEATFTISNGTKADLDIELSWASSVVNPDGSAIEATDLADLILDITDENGNSLENADGSDFEEYTIEDKEWSNGTYYVVASFYTAKDLGAGNTAELDIELKLNQLGVHDLTYTFEKGLNTGGSGYTKHVLAKITKTSSTYTIEKVVDGPEVIIDNFLNTYSITTSFDNGGGDIGVTKNTAVENGIILKGKFLGSTNTSDELKLIVNLDGTIIKDPNEEVADLVGTYPGQWLNKTLDYALVFIQSGEYGEDFFKFSAYIGQNITGKFLNKSKLVTFRFKKK